MTQQKRKSVTSRRLPIVTTLRAGLPMDTSSPLCAQQASADLAVVAAVALQLAEVQVVETAAAVVVQLAAQQSLYIMLQRTPFSASIKPVEAPEVLPFNMTF